MGNFVAIDFETATNERHSACAVGWVIVENWKVVEARKKLIQPPGNDYFWRNINIHEITPHMTENEPTFDEVWPEVEESIKGRLLIAHNSAFDISVLRRSAERTDCQLGDFNFACTYRLARDTWKYKWSHRLNDLAYEFNIQLDHHDPVSDAKAAAQIASEVCKTHEVSNIEQASEVLGYRLGEFKQGEYKAFSNAKYH